MRCTVTAAGVVTLLSPNEYRDSEMRDLWGRPLLLRSPVTTWSPQYIVSAPGTAPAQVSQWGGPVLVLGIKLDTCYCSPIPLDLIDMEVGPDHSSSASV